MRLTGQPARYEDLLLIAATQPVDHRLAVGRSHVEARQYRLCADLFIARGDDAPLAATGNDRVRKQVLAQRHAAECAFPHAVSS